MRLRTPALAVLVLGLCASSVIACGDGGGGGTTPSSDTGTNTDTGGASETGGDTGPSTTADPVPETLPELFANGDTPDVPADLSCAGKPIPVGEGAAEAHEFHMVELGGIDSDRVGGVGVEIFNDDVFDGTPDITTKADDGTADAAKKGVFTANVNKQFIAMRFPKTDATLETIALDFEIKGTSPILATVATASKADLISILAAGPDFKPSAGTARVVVRATDCQSRALSNGHMAIEIDGAIAKVTTGSTPGIKRSYFSDSSLPGTGKWSSRSGVVAFLDVPVGKPVRLVFFGKTDGSAKPSIVASRPIPVVDGAVVTATVTPYLAR
jgi:hypothetical protein